MGQENDRGPVRFAFIAAWREAFEEDLTRSREVAKVGTAGSVIALSFHGYWRDSGRRLDAFVTVLAQAREHQPIRRGRLRQ